MQNWGIRFDIVSMLFWGEPRHPFLDFTEEV